MSGDFFIQPVGNLGGDTYYISPKKTAQTTSGIIHSLVNPMSGSSLISSGSSTSSRVSFDVTSLGRVDNSPRTLFRKVSGE